MTAEELQEQGPEALAEYVWRRLRLDPPIDPPLADRHGAEPPEQFLIEAARQTPAFRDRLVQALRDVLRRLAEQQAREGASWADPVTNQQVASLAYLASRLPAPELVEPVYTLACSWFIDAREVPNDLDDGRFQVLRALAMLQQDSTLGPFWEALWRRGPRSIRGLTIFGWARSAPDRALTQLNELLRTEEVDLPATLWALIGPSGPGLDSLVKAARELPQRDRDKMRRALRKAGSDAATLEAFTQAEPAMALNGFPFTVTVNPHAVYMPSWGNVAA